MPKFTVILVRPDYIASYSSPVDTYTTYVTEENHCAAINTAQQEVAKADQMDSPEDYYPLGVFYGWIENFA